MGDGARSLRTVTGTLRCVEPWRSPLDRLSCAIAWTVLEGRGAFRLRRRVAVGTAGKLLLDSPEGLFAVDPRDLWVRRHEVRPQFPTVASALPEAIARAVLAAGIDPHHPLLYAEGYFHEGDEVVLRGLCRPESCPWLAGPREVRVLPTLRAHRGRLEILTPLGLVAAARPGILW